MAKMTLLLRKITTKANVPRKISSLKPTCCDPGPQTQTATGVLPHGLSCYQDGLGVRQATCCALGSRQVGFRGDFAWCISFHGDFVQ